jgi:hypothetical protein
MAPRAETIKAETLRAPAPISGPDGSRMADHVSSVGAQAQTGTPVQEWAIPVTSPRFRAEIGDIYLSDVQSFTASSARHYRAAWWNFDLMRKFSVGL